MAAVNVDQVYAALHVLHTNPDNEAKKEANKWLEDLQKSVYAWVVADQILQQNVSLEATYFAAQTMRTKIKYYFWELPPDTHLSLRDSLLQHMTRYRTSAPATKRQLCLALADLVCYMSQWEEALGTLIGLYGQDMDGLPLLLEVLQELTEEISADSLRLATSRVRALYRELDRHASQVMELVTRAMTFPQLQDRALKCFASWVHVGSFPDAMLASSPILVEAFATLTNSAAQVEVAADAICATLYVCRDRQDYEATLQGILPRIMLLRPVYHQAMQAGNHDQAYSIARVFVELGECCIQVILSSPDGIAPVEALVDCVRHPDYTVCEMTFRFWHLLVRELLRPQESGGEFYAGPLKDVFKELIVALAQHARYPESMESSSVLDREDDFYHFRGSLGHLVRKIGNLIGVQDSLKLMANYCQPFVSESALPESERWRGLEASLFCMGHIAAYAPTDDTVVVPAFLQQVHSLVTSSTAVPSVQQSCILAMGHCARWLGTQPQAVPDVLAIACMALEQPALASAASHTLCCLLNHCTEAVTKQLDSLLTTMQGIGQYKLHRDDWTSLYEALGRLVGGLPENIMAEKLQRLVYPIATSLSSVIQHSNAMGQESQAAGQDLGQLACIFKNIKIRSQDAQSANPIKPVAAVLLPLLQQAMIFYANDDNMMEKVCRTVKAILVCLKGQAVDMLSPLVQTMIQAYQKCTHSSLLYLASIVVRTVSNEPSYQQGLGDMLQIFVSPVFALLDGEAANGGDPFEQNPEIVEDFFRLLGAYVQNTPVMFLQTQVAWVATGLAIAGMHIGLPEPLSAMTWYLRDVLHEGSRDQSNGPPVVSAVNEIVGRYGQELVAAIIKAAGGSVPVYLLCEVSEVLWDLVCLCNNNKGKGSQWVQQDRVTTWIAAVFETLPETTLPQKAKSEFIVSVFGANDKRRMEDALFDLAHQFTGRNKLIE